ncbi:MAG: DNA protecting protein DprA [Spirochaetes bacterium RBG_16_49_21]|nr:MAG: DNA protecting protein DprA [Spirochaetes bacterium RBG_16_49_21]
MMQGIMFQSHDFAFSHAPLTNEDKICAVAISIVSSPGFNEIWNMISTCMPSEIYERISANRSLSTQEFLTEIYSAKPREAAEEIMDWSAAKSMRVLSYWDDEYPPLLREIERPPLVLYARGDMETDHAIAVVGTRKADPRSAAHARRIAGDLASAGFTIVSGMAVGIDRAAHLGALDADGRTIGVLANGIDIAYPSVNRDLHRRIASSPGSGLISEYPPGIRGGKWAFSRRNRIISGICAGTVVVKAGKQSGALITARHAVEQNREVFACTGNSFDEEYAGCHELIRSGAVLVSRTEDIINELSRPFGSSGASGTERSGSGAKGAVSDPSPEEDPYEEGSLESRILLLVSKQDYEIDSVIRQVGASPAEVNEAIVELELCGRITRSGNIIARL